jgi:hypothetical protein
MSPAQGEDPRAGIKKEGKSWKGLLGKDEGRQDGRIQKSDGIIPPIGLMFPKFLCCISPSPPWVRGNGFYVNRQY